MHPAHLVEHAEPAQVGLEQEDGRGVALQLVQSVGVQRDGHVGLAGGPGSLQALARVGDLEPAALAAGG